MEDAKNHNLRLRRETDLFVRPVGKSHHSTLARLDFLPSTLSLSDFLPHRPSCAPFSPCSREARHGGPSTSTLYVLPATPFRVPRRLVYPATRILSASSRSATTLDDATSNADYAAFDAPGPGPVRSTSRAWTQHTSYQLAHVAKEHLAEQHFKR